MAILLVVAGILCLIAGAEGLVRGASRGATGLGISPLVVGLTVVTFGTSAPELAVSMGSSPVGQTELALGNGVGSNIFSVLFILGLTVLIAPLAVSAQPVRLDVPLGIGVTVGMLLLAMDGPVGPGGGVVLVGGIVACTIVLVLQSGTRAAEDVGTAGTEARTEMSLGTGHWGLNGALGDWGTCPARAWGPRDRERRRCHCSAPRRE